MDKHKLRLSFYAVFTVVALFILVDFILPGKTINDEIINLKSERQQYYNAAANHHYSYQAVTSQHTFLVSEKFAKSDNDNNQIQYSVSRIFKEINWYKMLSSESKSFHSLRIMSGTVIPLLCLAFTFITFRYERKIDTLVFVSQVLLLADLIFLLR